MSPESAKINDDQEMPAPERNEKGYWRLAGLSTKAVGAAEFCPIIGAQVGSRAGTGGPSNH
jgi:hypothetical protein